MGDIVRGPQGGGVGGAVGVPGPVAPRRAWVDPTRDELPPPEASPVPGPTPIGDGWTAPAPSPTYPPGTGGGTIPFPTPGWGPVNSGPISGNNPPPRGTAPGGIVNQGETLPDPRTGPLKPPQFNPGGGAMLPPPTKQPPLVNPRTGPLKPPQYQPPGQQPPFAPPPVKQPPIPGRPTTGMSGGNMTDQTNSARGIAAPRIPPMPGGTPEWYGKNAPQGGSFTPPPSAGLAAGSAFDMQRKKKYTPTAQ